MRTDKGMSRLARGLVGVAIGAGMVNTAIGASITSTKHNLSSTGTGTVHTTAGTTEICVFCHTPHASDVSAAAPLWNKRVATGATYTTYASNTMTANTATDGVAGSTAIGSVSLACLSCHDGTQAMDNMLNAPGSGGYDVTGGATSGLAYTWNAGAQTSGVMLGTALANLGSDLRNDHPIGIQYCGGGIGNQVPAGTCNDGDFVTPISASIGGTNVWWVETGGNTTRAKTDMILFNRQFLVNSSGGAAGNYPSVECASCHDPHTTNTTFLRIANTGSAVCLACHNK